MPILTEVDVIENFSGIKNDLGTIGDAYHLCEIVDGLCPENQENSAVFDLFKDALHRLAFFPRNERNFVLNEEANNVFSQPQTTSLVNDSGIRSFINSFETELLTILGYLHDTGERINTHHFIESILERKLKSRNIFTKLQ